VELESYLQATDTQMDPISEINLKVVPNQS